MSDTTTSDTTMTIDDVREMLVRAVAAEAGLTPDEVATDRPFTDYGLDSMAALAVGVEIEDSCGLSDLPVSLLWDHPTVDALTDALWTLMNHAALAPAAHAGKG
jgi:acyl carrier protein